MVVVVAIVFVVGSATPLHVEEQSCAGCCMVRVCVCVRVCACVCVSEWACVWTFHDYTISLVIQVTPTGILMNSVSRLMKYRPPYYD